MNVWLDAILILIIILGLFIVASTRLGTMIQIFGMQSVILGCVPFFMYAKEMEVYIIIVSLAAIVLRGFIMPNFLFWAIRHVSVRSEVSPFIGVGTTLLLSGFSIVGSFLLASKLIFPVKISSEHGDPIFVFLNHYGIYTYRWTHQSHQPGHWVFTFGKRNIPFCYFIAEENASFSGDGDSSGSFHRGRGYGDRG